MAGIKKLGCLGVLSRKTIKTPKRMNLTRRVSGRTHMHNKGKTNYTDPEPLCAWSPYITIGYILLNNTLTVFFRKVMNIHDPKPLVFSHLAQKGRGKGGQLSYKGGSLGEQYRSRNKQC